MKSYGTRVLALLLCAVMLFSISCGRKKEITNPKENDNPMDAYIVKESNIPLKLWYNEEAPILREEVLKNSQQIVRKLKNHLFLPVFR